MRISTRGNDQGNAVLVSLILIAALSLIFLTIVPRISAMKRFSRAYKTEVIDAIQTENREIQERYDLR